MAIPLFQTNDKLYKCAWLKNFRENLSKKIKIRKIKDRESENYCPAPTQIQSKTSNPLMFSFLLKKKNAYNDYEPSFRMAGLQKIPEVE